MKWKIKRFTNDGLRQKFIDATVPQAQYLGLTIPDPELRFDEATGHWEHGAIDWDEFQPRARRRRALQSPAHEAQPAGRGRRRLGARGRRRLRRQATRRESQPRRLTPDSEATNRWPKPRPRSGKSSSDPATGLPIVMSARCTRMTPRWRCRPRATSTRGAARRCRSGSSRRRRSSPRTPRRKDMLFEPTATKIYRHPTFYEVPDEVGHM